MIAAAPPKLGLCTGSYISGRSCERMGEYLVTAGIGDDFKSLRCCGPHLENIVEWLKENAPSPSLQVIPTPHRTAGVL